MVNSNLFRQPYQAEIHGSQKHVELLSILFDGLSREQLKVLLGDKRILKVENEPQNPLIPYRVSIINFLIEKGAIEANPECDFAKLAESPGINFTPFRDKLKLKLAETRFLPEVLEEIVCDYLMGESVSRRVNPTP